VVLNETQSSVNAITKGIPGLSELPIYNQVLFKTLSDFGQIATYYSLLNAVGKINNQNIFITFDKICSRISALFLPYTLWENLDAKKSVAPITIFVTKPFRDLMFQVVGGILTLNPEVSSFGRRKRLPALTYRRKNTRTRQSTKKKIKHSEKVTKLAKKYRIPLNKNTVKNIKKLLTVQKKAKKLKVKLTKKS
jgi:hypothetical protein